MAISTQRKSTFVTNIAAGVAGVNGATGVTGSTGVTIGLQQV